MYRLQFTRFRVARINNMNKNLTFLNPPYNNDKYNMLTSSHHPINNEILQSLAKEENFFFLGSWYKMSMGNTSYSRDTNFRIYITKR